MGRAGFGSFGHNSVRGLMRAWARLAKMSLLALDGVGFVRRDCADIAGMARVRLAKIVYVGLRRFGFVRPHRVGAPGTRHLPEVKISQLAPARVAKETGDPPGLLIGLRVRVRQTKTSSPVGGPGRSPALRTARLTVGFRAATPQSHFP
jgi:hypothetical protein